MKNRVNLIGHLGKDPEVMDIEGGQKVANFTMATSETYKNKSGEKVINTEWHNIVVWRKTAEIAEMFLKKGSLIDLEGKIRTRSYYDKDGNKRYITEIVGDRIIMLGGKPQEDEPKQRESIDKQIPQQQEDSEDDGLPF